MTDYFYFHRIRIFDNAKWAEPLRDTLRRDMEQVAAEIAIEIEFVRSAKSSARHSIGDGIVRQL